MTLVQVQLGSTKADPPEPLAESNTVFGSSVGRAGVLGVVSLGVESEGVLSSVNTGSVGISPLGAV